VAGGGLGWRVAGLFHSALYSVLNAALHSALSGQIVICHRFSHLSSVIDSQRTPSNTAFNSASVSGRSNPKADASKLAIGQERDAIQHPGKESFDGEIARFLLWDRPLTDAELKAVFEGVK